MHVFKQTLLTVLGLVLFALPAAAQTFTGEHIQRFDALYQIQQDGSIVITESILYDFGAQDRHGIFREVVERFSVGPDFVDLNVELISITDENGNPYLFTERSDYSSVEYKIGDPDKTITGAHWYVITYHVDGGVRGLPDHDEFYWNVTGDGWQVPITEATARVVLPSPSAAADLRATCFSGASYSTEPCANATLVDASTIEFSAQSLFSYQGLTAVAGFSKGVVDQPRRASAASDYTAEIVVNPDASITVEEAVTVQLGEGTAQELLFSIDRTALDGEAVGYLPVQVEQVHDAGGNELPYELLELGSDAELIVDLPTSEAQRYTIRYRIPFAVNQSTTGQVLSRSAVSFATRLQLDNPVVTVRLPEGVGSDGIGTSCSDAAGLPCETTTNGDGSYTFTKPTFLEATDFLITAVAFPAGTTTAYGTAHISSPQNGVSFYADGSLTGRESPALLRTDQEQVVVEASAYRHATVAVPVEITAGEVTEVEIQLKKIWYWVLLESVVPFVLLIAGMWLIYTIWKRYGKNATGRGTVVPQYEPPQNMSPAEMGVVYDGKAHMHDITAGIIDLAVRGFLTIEQKEGKKPLIGKAKDEYTFVKVREPKEDELLPHEQKLFRAIFSSKNSNRRTLESMKNKFYTKLPDIKRKLYKAVVDGEYYPRNPDTVKRGSIAVGVGALIALPIVAIVLTESVDSTWYLLLAILGPIAFITSFFMVRRTKKGAEALEHIEGLKLYLTVAEKDRIKFHQSPKAYKQHFEALLPYAIVLEVEEEWAAAFEELFDEPLDWVDSYTAFAGAHLVSSMMSDFTSATSSAIASTPSSSGSGGSGFSGGFSGGGFSGGGGGSW